MLDTILSPLNLNLGGSPRVQDRLKPLMGFGTNPGNLNAYFTRPPQNTADGFPLVVVLHGCTQTATSYDEGSGWSELAARYGFATLHPEQQRANNPNLCFNWFHPADTRRGAGEAQSIAQMIEAMISTQRIDRDRVFITGLSAGGAMTSVMLASYPEMFAGGAIIAGLPHGAAESMPEALRQMRAHAPSSRTTGQALKVASPHNGPWPTILVWHGTADTVVSPSNADAILRQWQEVHEVHHSPSQENLVDGFPHRVWSDNSGKVLVEDYRITGMGHGTPLATGRESGSGRAGAFMLEVGISSTIHSAQTWGLLSIAQRQDPTERVQLPTAQESESTTSERGASSGADRITRVIEDALRRAGLMKKD